MWTLYGSQGSGSAAAEMALQRCGVPFQVQRASTWEADSAQDELRKVNSLGQIPTLTLGDGAVMTESAAILIQPGLEFPAAGLLPADPAARRRSLRGLVYSAANCYAAIGIIDYSERWTTATGEAEREHLRQGIHVRLHECWSLFADQFLSSSPFLDGAAPGALGMLGAVVSRWSGTRAYLRQQRPALAALFDRVEQHPDLSPVFARHWPAS
ncbi:MAG: glutathione S-transferase family protein [Rubrivivax sp.]|nr:glutathione S-transferase family protein [Rubrivivax sp.]